MYTSDLHSGALSTMQSRNIYLRSMLATNDRYNIETIAVVLTYEYHNLILSYNNYKE